MSPFIEGTLGLKLDKILREPIKFVSKFFAIKFDFDVPDPADILSRG